MTLTGEIIVQFPEEYTEKNVSEIEFEYGLSRVKAFTFVPNTFLYRVRDTLGSLDAANAMHQSKQVNIIAMPRGRTATHRDWSKTCGYCNNFKEISRFKSLSSIQNRREYTNLACN